MCFLFERIKVFVGRQRCPGLWRMYRTARGSERVDDCSTGYPLATARGSVPRL